MVLMRDYSDCSHSKLCSIRLSKTHFVSITSPCQIFQFPLQYVIVMFVRILSALGGCVNQLRPYSCYAHAPVKVRAAPPILT